MRFERSTLIALAGAAVFACACGPSDTARNDNNSKTPPPAGTAGASGAAAASDTDAKKPAVVLTGCLQEEKGMLGNYILTQASQAAPDEAVGTSGDRKDTDKNANSKIEQRQLAQAAHSYRLNGESDQLKDHVGHQIRVRGNLADKSDLKDADHDVSQSDLAKVDVQSVEMVANSCSAKK
jgi:hypothetical protein